MALITYFSFDAMRNLAERGGIKLSFNECVKIENHINKKILVGKLNAKSIRQEFINYLKIHYNNINQSVRQLMEIS